MIIVLFLSVSQIQSNIYEFCVCVCVCVCVYTHTKPYISYQYFRLISLTQQKLVFHIENECHLLKVCVKMQF